MKQFNPFREKILLLLLAGFALCFTYSPHRQRRIFKATCRAWKKINEKKLKQEIFNLHRSRLIERKRDSNGLYTYILTDKGKLKALGCQLKKMKNRKTKWSGKYMVAMFDIPEDLKKTRDTFRRKLKEIGFYELQKSVFVFPFNCRKELKFLIDFLHLKNYVKYGFLELCDDNHLKKIFGLN